MSVNLLKTLQRGLGDSLIKNASGFLNESEETASKAVKGTYSVLLASVIDKGSTEKGACLLYTSPSPRDRTRSRMPSSA